jgi:hypothetical protein
VVAEDFEIHGTLLVRDQRSEVRDQMSDVRCQKGRMSEVRYCPL